MQADSGDGDGASYGGHMTSNEARPSCSSRERMNGQMLPKDRTSLRSWQVNSLWHSACARGEGRVSLPLVGRKGQKQRREHGHRSIRFLLVSPAASLGHRAVGTAGRRSFGA